MSFSFDDLSPATLDCLEDLIEQRLNDPDAALVPATWREAALRDQADRELTCALREIGRRWNRRATAQIAAPPASTRLH